MPIGLLCKAIAMCDFVWEMEKCRFLLYKKKGLPFSSTAMVVSKDKPFSLIIESSFCFASSEICFGRDKDLSIPNAFSHSSIVQTKYSNFIILCLIILLQKSMCYLLELFLLLGRRKQGLLV